MALRPADDEEFTMETRVASPIHLLVEIESFSMSPEHGIQKYESREFVSGDYKWRLIIYPSGNGKEAGDHISAYLSMVKTSSLPIDWEVNAMFSIFLYNHILDNYLCFRGKVERFHAINSQRGFSKLISKKSLTDPSNGYLVNDNCVFGAEVVVAKSQRVIEHVSLLKVTKPCKRDWKISQYSKLEGVWTSEEFPVGGQQWNITLHPNGNGIGKGRNVSMYMECVGAKSFAPHQKVKADFCLRIKNNTNNLHRHGKCNIWFTSCVTSWGYSEFITIAEMLDPSKGYVIDDCCFLEIEIAVQAVVRV